MAGWFLVVGIALLFSGGFMFLLIAAGYFPSSPGLQRVRELGAGFVAVAGLVSALWGLRGLVLRR